MARRGHGAFPTWLSSREEFHFQPVAIQNNILYNKPRAALVTIPPLTDNPLFETTQEECRRFAAPRLSLEESHFRLPARRTGSLSLSAKDYEGIWRAVQEDVSKSSTESKSPLEDFKEFRQKLALLKQDMTGSTVARSGLTSSGSTRSLNISPSRPTSPLKRLSVMASRRTASASGLNPQLGNQRVPPTVQKIAVSMRAEGLFKLPSPAAITPVPLSEIGTPASRVSSTPTKRRFSLPARKSGEILVSVAESTDVSRRSGETPESREELILDHVQTSGETPVGKGEKVEVGCSRKSGENRAVSDGRAQHPRKWGTTSATGERKNTSTAAARKLPSSIASKAPKTPPQQVQPKKSSSFSSRDWKVRCIPIPRPVCYSANILE